MSLPNKIDNLIKEISTQVDAKQDDEIEDEEFVVKGTEVSGKVDYEKLCVQFGCDLLTDDMISTMEKLTGKRVHPMIRRKLYYAHRDFDKILECHAKGKPWYLYTGRGKYENTIINFIRNFCSYFLNFLTL